jgi:hypothetical protein
MMDLFLLKQAKLLKPKSSRIKLLLSVLFTLSTITQAIVIRHDVDDKHYLATVDDFPPLATLYKIGVHGTLIDSQWVVTAAHAVFCMNEGVKIQVGNQTLEVAGRYSHPKYKLDSDYDISLIKLVKPVQGITPAEIYTDSDELGQSIWFIGSGATGDGAHGQTVDIKENKGVLRKAQNRIIDVDDTEIIFNFEEGEKGEPLEGVSGNADSGGPAYLIKEDGYHLLGISSRNDSWFKDVGEYGVTEKYSRVSFHAKWISTIINGSEKQRQSVSTQNKFLQDNMKGGAIKKICPMINF